MFNTFTNGADCGAGGNQWVASAISTSTQVSVKINLDSTSDVNGKVTINMTGPDGKWFGIGLGAKTFTMSDRPYTIIVDGDGAVTERKLGNYNGGKLLDPSVQVVSSRSFNGIRNVVMTRTYQGNTAEHYTFDPKTASTIPHITASGSGPKYSYHGSKTRGGATLQLFTIDTPICICNTGIKGSNQIGQLNDFFC